MDNYNKFLWSFYKDEELQKIIKYENTLTNYVEDAKEELSNRQESKDKILGI